MLRYQRRTICCEIKPGNKNRQLVIELEPAPHRNRTSKQNIKTGKHPRRVCGGHHIKEKISEAENWWRATHRQKGIQQRKAIYIYIYIYMCLRTGAPYTCTQCGSSIALYVCTRCGSSTIRYTCPCSSSMHAAQVLCCSLFSFFARANLSPIHNEATIHGSGQGPNVSPLKSTDPESRCVRPTGVVAGVVFEHVT